MIYNGYHYKRNKLSKDGKTSYFTCTSKKCLGRLIIYENNKIEETGHHTCPLIPHLDEIKSFPKALISAAANGNELMKSIYERLAIGYENATSTCSLEKGIQKMISARQRALDANFEKIKTIKDFVTFLSTSFSDNALRLEHRNGYDVTKIEKIVVKDRMYSHIIFKDNVLFERLKNEKLFYIHEAAHNKLDLEGSSYLMTLLVQKSKKDYPCIWFLLENVDETSLKSVFLKVKENWPEWKPETILIKYNKKLWNIIEEIFETPSMTVTGTFCSYLQELLSYAFNIGYDTSNLIYNEKDPHIPLIYYLGALPVLPAQFIVPEFNKFKINAKTTQEKKLILQFENFWIQEIGSEFLSTCRKLEKLSRCMLQHTYLLQSITQNQNIKVKDLLKVILKTTKTAHSNLDETGRTEQKLICFNETDLVYNWRHLLDQNELSPKKLLIKTYHELGRSQILNELVNVLDLKNSEPMYKEILTDEDIENLNVIFIGVESDNKTLHSVESVLDQNTISIDEEIQLVHESFDNNMVVETLPPPQEPSQKDDQTEKILKVSLNRINIPKSKVIKNMSKKKRLIKKKLDENFLY